MAESEVKSGQKVSVKIVVTRADGTVEEYDADGIVTDGRRPD